LYPSTQEVEILKEASRLKREEVKKEIHALIPKHGLYVYDVSF
jgi:hypothetical protein